MPHILVEISPDRLAGALRGELVPARAGMHLPSVLAGLGIGLLGVYAAYLVRQVAAVDDCKVDAGAATRDEDLPLARGGVATAALPTDGGATGLTTGRTTGRTTGLTTR